MGIQSEKMFLFLFCLGITGSLAEIPLFGPVERRTCIRERYYFATNALYRNFEKAKRNCDYYKCDIIIKYEAGMEYQMRNITLTSVTLTQTIYVLRTKKCHTKSFG